MASATAIAKAGQVGPNLVADAIQSMAARADFGKHLPSARDVAGGRQRTADRPRPRPAAGRVLSWPTAVARDRESRRWMTFQHAKPRRIQIGQGHGPFLGRIHERAEPLGREKSTSAASARSGLSVGQAASKVAAIDGSANLARAFSAAALHVLRLAIRKHAGKQRTLVGEISQGEYADSFDPEVRWFECVGRVAPAASSTAASNCAWPLGCGGWPVGQRNSAPWPIPRQIRVPWPPARRIGGTEGIDRGQQAADFLRAVLSADITSQLGQQMRDRHRFERKAASAARIDSTSPLPSASELSTARRIQLVDRILPHDRGQRRVTAGVPLFTQRERQLITHADIGIGNQRV